MKIKKITKIFLIIMIMSFTSMLAVKADDPVTTKTNEQFVQEIRNDYPFYEKAYKIIGAVSYYHDHAAVFDASNEPDRAQVLTDAIGTFQLAESDKDFVMSLYTEFKKGTNSTEFARMIGDSYTDTISDVERKKDYLDQLGEFNNLASMFKYSKNTLSSLIKSIKNRCNENSSTECTDAMTLVGQYETLIENTIRGYESFCDKLGDSPGITHYLKSALQLVSYAALALAVILGALDFVKAITSQDDAALTKAFQSFVKRMVAVALIFMTYVIVELVLGLITYVPGTQASQLEICEEIRLGALKG